MNNLVSVDFVDVEELSKSKWYIDYMDVQERKRLIRNTITVQLEERMKKLKLEKKSKP